MGRAEVEALMRVFDWRWVRQEWEEHKREQALSHPAVEAALQEARRSSSDLDALAARLTEALAERDAAVARAAELAAVVDEKCAALDQAWAWFESQGEGRNGVLTHDADDRESVLDIRGIHRDQPRMAAAMVVRTGETMLLRYRSEDGRWRVLRDWPGCPTVPCALKAGDTIVVVGVPQP